MFSYITGKLSTQQNAIKTQSRNTWDILPPYRPIGSKAQKTQIEPQSRRKGTRCIAHALAATTGSWLRDPGSGKICPRVGSMPVCQTGALKRAAGHTKCPDLLVPIFLAGDNSYRPRRDVPLCCFNAGLPSQTAARHWNNTGPTTTAGTGKRPRAKASILDIGVTFDFSVTVFFRFLLWPSPAAPTWDFAREYYNNYHRLGSKQAWRGINQMPICLLRSRSWY